MPQTGMNYEGRRRGTRRSTCKANGLVPGTDLVNGAIAHNGYPAAATSTNESTPAGTLNGTKPQCMVNGYINHEYKSRKSPPPRTLRKHGSTIPAVSDASTSGRVSSADNAGGISVNGAASLDSVASPCYSNQMAPEPSPSAAAKRRGRWKKFGRKKRPTLLPPQEQEDWESEIQEVTVPDWEKMCFGLRPYGPEDVLHFALRDLRLKQTQITDLPLTANYRPALHHPHPVKWSCYSIPTEPDQFADADESMDSFVVDKLTQWQLTDLVDSFKDEGIDEERFLLLDEGTIKLLIPKAAPGSSSSKIWSGYRGRC